MEMLNITIVHFHAHFIFFLFPVSSIPATLRIFYWSEIYMSFPLTFSSIFLQLTLDVYGAF